jgi:hypothetical protein
VGSPRGPVDHGDGPVTLPASPEARWKIAGRAEPALVVDELSDRTHGSLGVWVGEGSGGHFANLRVTRTR